ncbi:MAG: tRNA pseudouridine(55) synthase TruB, partial [Vicinamibacterales bacterium]
MVDKPEGMTSHDVVSIARRTLKQTRIGHTGTLDPFATGVLPLACGRATRLVRFMASASKTYEATIRFGLVTDTYDITGTAVMQTDTRPSAEAVRAEIESLSRERMQEPPPYSAKKVAGKRAYELARKNLPVTLEPVPVHVSQVDVLDLTPDRAVVRLTCSAGFFVRSFAHDLGSRLGAGACLETLRRTRSGHFDLDQAVTLAGLQAGEGPDAMLGLDRLLPDFAEVVVNVTGRERLGHGQTIRPGDISRHSAVGVRPGPGSPGGAADQWVRISDDAGTLVGVGTWDGPDATLRPNIVLI